MFCTVERVLFHVIIVLFAWGMASLQLASPHLDGGGVWFARRVVSARHRAVSKGATVPAIIIGLVSQLRHAWNRRQDHRRIRGKMRALTILVLRPLLMWAGIIVRV